MSQFRGFVARISEKESPANARRKWTLYSFKVEKEDGTEYEDWVTFGFDPPPFKEGDFIEFEAQKNDKGYLQYVSGTGKQIKNPPARGGAKSTAQVGGGNAGVVPPTQTSGVSGTVGQPTNDRQTSIVLQHSQEMALRAVAILLEHDGLPMSAAKTPAGTAKRFAEINAMIDKLTRRFYDDTNSDRILTLVAPTVTDTAADGPLPAVATEKPKTQAVKAATVTVGTTETTEGVF